MFSRQSSCCRHRVEFAPLAVVRSLVHRRPHGRQQVARGPRSVIPTLENMVGPYTVSDNVLTRLKVAGFKNLDHIDVRLGPFTCIAGPNGVGKSNLFDAIAFLAVLADKPLVEAALAVRGGDSRRGDVQSLFRRVGNVVADKMTFATEFLIPEHGEDELGQAAKASMTFLQYELELRYRQDSAIKAMGALEIVREKMVHINRSAAKNRLGFFHKKSWRDSVVKGRRTSPYISTEIERDGEPVVSLHADSVAGLGGGRPRRVPAANLPRTMLSSVNNAAEHRTLVLARRMAGWTQLRTFGASSSRQFHCASQHRTEWRASSGDVVRSCAGGREAAPGRRSRRLCSRRQQTVRARGECPWRCHRCRRETTAIEYCDEGLGIPNMLPVHCPMAHCGF